MLYLLIDYHTYVKLNNVNVVELDNFNKKVKTVLTFDIECDIFIAGGEKVSDVRKVFITREVADELKLTPTYLIKLGKKIKLSEAEMREAGSRNYLFSEEAVQKLKNAKQQK